MVETALIKKSKSYAESILSQMSDSYTYHNLAHTRKVVDAVYEIGKVSGLSEDQMESAIIAAWIHDTGYIQGAENHEYNSVEGAKKILKSWGASDDAEAADEGATARARREGQRPAGDVRAPSCPLVRRARSPVRGTAPWCEGDRAAGRRPGR